MMLLVHQSSVSTRTDDDRQDAARSAHSRAADCLILVPFLHERLDPFSLTLVGLDLDEGLQ